MSADWMFGEYSVGGTLSAFSERFEEDSATRCGWGLHDARPACRLALRPRVGRGLRFNNLAGKVYETAYGFNQPGREMS